MLLQFFYMKGMLVSAHQTVPWLKPHLHLVSKSDLFSIYRAQAIMTLHGQKYVDTGALHLCLILNTSFYEVNIQPSLSLAASTCSHSATLVRSVSQFIPKVLDRVDARDLCMPIKIFHT